METITRERNICVNVIFQDQTLTFHTYQHEYRSLMALIYDKIYIENFGDCKGIGRCGTCHVEIIEGDEALTQRQGNENTTLSKMPYVTATSRLACSMPVDGTIDRITIKIRNDDGSRLLDKPPDDMEIFVPRYDRLVIGDK